MDTMATSSRIMDENNVNVGSKDEAGDRFGATTYIDEICSGSFEKVFLPMESNEVDFPDEMVKLDLEIQNPSHQNWVAQIESTNNGIRPHFIQFGDKTNEQYESAIISEKHKDRERKNRHEKSEIMSGIITVPAVNIEEALKHQNYPNIQQPKFYKIQCSTCKKWFLNNDSMITHLRSRCSGISGREGYLCQMCQQTFPDELTLQNHILEHKNLETSLECEICQRKFAYKFCLRNHVQAHVTQKSMDICACSEENFHHHQQQSEKHLNIDEQQQFPCQICQFRCRDKISEKSEKSDICEKKDNDNEKEISPNIKSFRCGICQRFFGQKNALNNHMLSHNNSEKPHACNMCEKSYKKKSELTRHAMVHTGERPYECKECLMTFREKAKLNSHMLVHTGEKPHECHICQKACARKSDLNSHMLSHTGGQYDCKICYKIFTRKSDLNRHTLIHTGEKPFACDLCFAAYREKTRLNSHMLIHTGDERHICHICGKGFREKTSLKKHMLIHTGERLYECCICKKAFTQKTTLNSHMLVHSEDRPYECGSCPKSFREKSALKKHWLIHVKERESLECKSEKIIDIPQNATD